MKSLMLALLLGLTLASGPRAQAQQELEDIITYGTEVPFPFGTEIPFPLTSVEGTWEVRDREIDAYFSFRVQRDERGKTFLKVIHFDKITRQIAGEGLGVAQNDQKVVRAVMQKAPGHPGPETYWVVVRVFRDTRTKTQRTATVLTISNFPNGDQGPVLSRHFILRKVSKSTITPR